MFGRDIFLVMVVVFSVLSCSHQHYCPATLEVEPRGVKIGKVVLKNESISIEIINLSSDLVYLPAKLAFNCAEGGKCFVDNDVYATSVAIPIKVQEIQPSSSITLSCEIKGSLIQIGAIELDLLYVLAQEKVLFDNEFSNYDLIEKFNNDIQQFTKHLVECKK